MFHTSDKVVCIDDTYDPTDPRAAYFSALPVNGTVYVVRDCRVRPSGRYAVYLTGITGKVHPMENTEYGFRSDRFRKLEDLRQQNQQQHAQKNIHQSQPVRTRRSNGAGSQAQLQARQQGLPAKRSSC